MRKDREDIYSIKMKLKDQVVSVGLARELKELGVEQEDETEEEVEENWLRCYGAGEE